MSIRRLTVGTAIVASVYMFAAMALNADSDSGALRRVVVSKGEVRVYFTTPKGMAARGLQFFIPASGQTASVAFFDKTDIWTKALSRSVWISNNDFVLDNGPLPPRKTAKLFARLLYSNPETCKPPESVNYQSLKKYPGEIIDCPGIKRSNRLPLIIKSTDEQVPASPIPAEKYGLVASNSGSGVDANPSIAVTLHKVVGIEVRTRATESDLVDVTWDLTCTKGQSVEGKSGQDEGPGRFTDAIEVPFDEADSCILSVGVSYDSSDLQFDANGNEIPLGELDMSVWVEH